MDIRKSLNDYQWIKKNIENLENRLVDIDSNLKNISKNVSRIKANTQLLEQKEKTENFIKTRLHIKYQEVEDIKELISCLPEKEKEIMELRYIECLSWEKIAEELFYSSQYVQRLHSKCIKELIKNNEDLELKEVKKPKSKGKVKQA